MFYLLKRSYRLAVLHRMPQLDSLDDEIVHAEEKVAATNLFLPPPEVRAAADHRIQRLYQLFQPQALHERYSSDLHLQMLIRVGF